MTTRSAPTAGPSPTLPDRLMGSGAMTLSVSVLPVQADRNTLRRIADPLKRPRSTAMENFSTAVGVQAVRSEP